MGYNGAYDKQRKLNAQQVRNIRLLCSREWFSIREVARVFRVSYKTIYDIYKGRIYKDIM